MRLLIARLLPWLLFFTIGRFFAGILCLILQITVIGWIKKIILKGFQRLPRFDETVGRLVASAARYAVLALTVIAVLSEFGVETTSFVALVGTVGLAIGLALQGTLSNVAAGVLLLLFRPFKVGDYIEAGISIPYPQLTVHKG